MRWSGGLSPGPARTLGLQLGTYGVQLGLQLGDPDGRLGSVGFDGLEPRLELLAAQLGLGGPAGLLAAATDGLGGALVSGGQGTLKLLDGLDAFGELGIHVLAELGVLLGPLLGLDTEGLGLLGAVTRPVTAGLEKLGVSDLGCGSATGEPENGCEHDNQPGP